MSEDDTPSDLHREASIFRSQTTQISGPQVGYDMVIGVHEEVNYWSPRKSSGKQRKKRSTSQPQFRSENTFATIEADQMFLALPQLTNNKNSANFHSIIKRKSKLPKSLTTSMPTFDGKTEKFEPFEDLFQASFKIHNPLTEDDTINYFHSLMMGDALQTNKNNNGPTEKTCKKSCQFFERNT